MGIHYEPSAGKIAHFAAIPWCAAILRDTAYTPVDLPRPGSRASVPDEDAFMSDTLHTERTIRAALTLQRRKDNDNGDDDRDGSSSSSSSREVGYSLPDEIRMLVDLGAGVSGFPNVCHGGFIATLLDEATGILLDLRKKHEVEARPHMTAYLNVTFRKPVPSPGIVQVRARAVKVAGRKIWIDGSIEDEHGDVCSTAEALFVQLKSAL